MNAVRKSSMFAVVLLGMFAASASAQDTVAARIPFPFVVGTESFPAGHYDIQPASLGSAVIVIRGMDKQPSAGFALTDPAGGTDPDGDQPVLVFKRWENTYRLAAIWQSTAEGRELPPFKDPEAGASNGAPSAADESTCLVSARLK